MDSVPISRLRAAVCVLAAAVVACLMPSLAAARVPQGFVGMNLDGPVFPNPYPGVDLAHQLDMMVASGVENVHAPFYWSQAQPYASWSQVPPSEAGQFENGPGNVPTRWGPMDQLAALAAQRGLTVLPTVLDAPGWDAACHQCGFPVINAHPPKSDRPFAAFMTALVDRYGPNGTFWSSHSPKVPIRRWQIWNEPNITGFWPIQPFQHSYVALLRAAHAAIKQADPGAEVVLAGFVNASWVYINRVYKVKGSRGLFDIVGVHPYTRHPQGILTILGNVRKVMSSHGDSRKPIVVDEMGWMSSVGQSPEHVGIETTEQGQARNLAAALPMIARNRRRLGIVAFDYYDWAGIEDRGGSEFHFAGLFRFRDSRFVAKPAFGVFRRDGLALEGCRTKGSLATVCASPASAR